MNAFIHKLVVYNVLANKQIAQAFYKHLRYL